MVRLIEYRDVRVVTQYLPTQNPIHAHCEAYISNFLTRSPLNLFKLTLFIYFEIVAVLATLNPVSLSLPVD